MRAKLRQVVVTGTILMLGALLIGAGVADRAAAQAMGAPLSDLAFEVVNATTGEPGTIDRLEIYFMTATNVSILDDQPGGSRFTMPRVPIHENQAYLVKAWKHGVPYYWQLRGGKLVDNVTQLYVFDTTSDLGETVIEGLTLIMKQSESLLTLEYMLSVQNPIRPQMTVMRDPGTVEIVLPAGADEIEAEYLRGPNPTPVAVRELGGGRVALQAPLTSGANRIRVTSLVPWRDGMTFPLEFNLPVKAWSILASPESLDVRSYDLEPDDEQSIPGHQRLRGSELAAGRDIELRLVGGHAAGAGEDLFTTEAPKETDQVAEASPDQDESGGPPYLLLIAGLLVILIAYALIRRRS